MILDSLLPNLLFLIKIIIRFISSIFYKVILQSYIIIPFIIFIFTGTEIHFHPFLSLVTVLKQIFK